MRYIPQLKNCKPIDYQHYISSSAHNKKQSVSS
nr:MAG TPA: hypothetical protein [Caudoviricetes sp.]